MSNAEFNRSQLVALVTTLAAMGDIRPMSLSLSAIIGPPGTWNSTYFRLLIGTSMSHSKVGHLYKCAEYYNRLNVSEHFLSKRRNAQGVRILIFCSGNQSVDAVAKKLREGVPDGNSAIFVPNTVCHGRQGCEYGDLRSISLEEKAFTFNGPFTGRNPSTKANKLFSKKCVVFLCTSATAESSVLRSLGVPFDVLISDKASFSSEPETMIPVGAIQGRQKTLIQTILSLSGITNNWLQSYSAKIR